jgi:hypothetical protein
VNSICGGGFTRTVTVVLEEHPLGVVAVMVNVAVWTAVVIFVNVPVIVAPVPFAGIPVRLTVLFLVQLNVVPGRLFGFEILIVLIAPPVQIVCVVGVALTVAVVHNHPVEAAAGAQPAVIV